MKVDVEGGELEIVKGMGRLLGARRVPIMSFEYAFGWNRLFNLRRPLTFEERRNASATSLRRFSSEMSRFGYLTYLVASGKRASWPHGVVLLPVYGQFWHDDYEVSTAPTSACSFETSSLQRKDRAKGGSFGGTRRRPATRLPTRARRAQSSSRATAFSVRVKPKH